MAPILTSFSVSVVSDNCRTVFGSASRRRKFLMVYAKASTGGEKKLDVRVSRHDALWDSYQHVEKRGLLSSAAEPVCYKVRI